jgi:CTD kinase subunit alpha
MDSKWSLGHSVMHRDTNSGFFFAERNSSGGYDSHKNNNTDSRLSGYKPSSSYNRGLSVRGSKNDDRPEAPGKGRALHSGRDDTRVPSQSTGGASHEYARRDANSTEAKPPFNRGANNSKNNQIYRSNRDSFRPSSNGPPSRNYYPNDQDYDNNNNSNNFRLRSKSISPSRENTAHKELPNVPRGPKKMSFKLPKTEGNIRNYGNARSYRPNKALQEPPSQPQSQSQSYSESQSQSQNRTIQRQTHRVPLNRRQQQYPNQRTQTFKPKEPPKVSFLKTNRTTTIYEKVIQVGEGTYGKVYKSQNVITRDFVALKKLRMESEREGFPITAMREIRLLQSFDHDNVVSLLEIMVESKQIHMIFNYAEHDLTGILSNPDISLTAGHCKNLFRQLLQGMDYLHSKRVIHRDIKGSNLLIDRNGVLKITDFGLARKMKPIDLHDPISGESDYTNRVITLWYRPPELLLGTTSYGREVDMWGVGCLLVELFTKKALFQAQDEIQQIVSIFEILGTPNFEKWKGLNNLPWFEMLKPKRYYESRFEEVFRDLSTPLCFELALKLLEYDPAKRISAHDALSHGYFKEDPPVERLDNGVLNGEWHEFEAKKRRQKEREERKLEERKRRKLNEQDGVVQDEETKKDSTEEPQDPPSAPAPEIECSARMDGNSEKF